MGRAVNGNGVFAVPTKGPNLVEADDVIDVIVGVEDVIDFGEPLSEGLFAEVRTGVYENFDLVCLEENGGAGSRVPWIGGSADFASATDDRNSHGGAGAKKCQSCRQGSKR